MGMSKVYYLSCDKCGDGWDDYNGSDERELIEMAHADGWELDNTYAPVGEVGYACPLCKGDN
jgi:hypothetical protein